MSVKRPYTVPPLGTITSRIARAVIPIAALFCLVAHPPAAWACPTIDGLNDYNCDTGFKMVFFGDSIVRGVGDVRNNNDGGYPLRLGAFFPDTTVVNLGIPGISTRRLLRYLIRRFNEPTHADTIAMQNADFVSIGVGTNDFYDHGEPGLTVRNIKRIAKLIKKKLTDVEGVSPVLAVAKLTPTTRGFQRGFIHSVNSLLDRYKSGALPVRLYFDRISTSQIGGDGLHPTAKGYSAMASIARRFMTHELQRYTKRPDLDGDGVADKFESIRFGTDPQILDSDGDGRSDGEEIFTYETDPLVAD